MYTAGYAFTLNLSRDELGEPLLETNSSACDSMLTHMCTPCCTLACSGPATLIVCAVRAVYACLCVARACVRLLNIPITSSRV